MTAPTWTAQPPTDAWQAAIAAAEFAAHGDPLRCLVALAESGCNPGWLVITSVQLLAAVIHEGASADELRSEVLRVADVTGASDYTTVAALEAVALAEAVQRGELATVRELCSGSQVSARDLTHAACAITGQAIAALAVDVSGVFDRLRSQFGGAA
ncbi:hypothetical protein [Mycolicibacter kumamotonensis]|uniref:Uncharacterized protein n=1 Tax=Mycolicibacter kumamotonensis TaxID=354243 RepID=A0A1B8SBC6_9MYCO|nr:hypothetical protein [Mycolicibacter kumamotonensis]OBY30041.1 hypothetical protein ACT18_19890 [Mycolicibacter kumamotonensis]